MDISINREQIGQWVERVLKPVLRGDVPPQEDVERLGGLALLSADTDKIKEYVFESAKLPEIRGASMILDELNWGERPVIENGVPRNLAGVWEKYGLPLETRIYAGGGSLLALVPRDLSEELKREIEALYPRETGMATITCVYLDASSAERQKGYQPGAYPADRLWALDSLPIEFQHRIAEYYGKQAIGEIDDAAIHSHKHFGELVKIQALCLRRAKEEKKAVPFFEAIPYARRCQSCGKRPAMVFEQYPAERYLCHICCRKAGKATSSIEWKPSERRARKSIWHERFEKAQGVTSVPAGDIEDIAKATKQPAARNYIGFIYADGNNVGAIVESSHDVDEFRRKSDMLQKTMAEAVYRALGKHLPRLDKSFEIITIGGDDVLLIVPGDVALAIARELCHIFEVRLRAEGFQLENGRSATMSAGVVIAEHHNPIYFLRDLSEVLLKSAKRRAKMEKTQEGTVDFLVLKSQTILSTDLTHLRHSWPWKQEHPDVNERLFLTRRPYTLSGLQRLMGLAHLTKETGFPRTQLYALQEAVTNQGRLPSSIYFLYQHVRQRDDDKKAFFQELLFGGLDLKDKDAMASVFPGASPPWRQRPPGNAEPAEYDTILADLLEILDFAEEG
ncbi:MAG: hypothetical protein ISS50_02290 [Anaerolineae bacterium]|nr:hypothetical protein [Anaerolineae bacterium]